MVCPLREGYLPSTGLHPSQTHHLLAQDVWPVSHPLRVLASTLARHTPPQSQIQYLIHPTNIFSIRTPIQRIQVISAKESGVIFFFKKEREKKKSTLHP